MAESVTEEPKERITTLTAFLLILIAIPFDLLQVLLLFFGVGAILDDLLSIIAGGLFGFAFLLLRVKFLGGSKVGMKVTTMVGSTVVELVPILNALPTITAGTIGIIHATRKEDAEKKAKHEEWKKKQVPKEDPRTKVDWYLANQASIQRLREEEESDDDEEVLGTEGGRELVS